MAGNKADNKNDPSNQNDSSGTPEIDVVDAEIVEDNEADRSTPPPDPKPVEAVPVKTKPGGKMGWIFAGLLVAFIGGLFAAPYAQNGLRTLGLLPALPASTATADGEDTFAPLLADIETRLSDTALSLERLQVILAQHEQGLEDAAAARALISNDVALLASQNAAQNAGTAGTTSTVEVAALRDRVAALTDDVARLAALSTEQNPEVTGLSGAVALARAEAAQLKSKLENLETVVVDLQAGALDVSPRGRMLVSVGRLKDQALRGMAFGGELVALRAEIAVMPALDQQMIGADVAVLARHPDGIRPYDALVRDYGAAASAAKLAQEKTDGSLLASLFTVRRTDDGATGIDAVLLEAERQLLARDVAGALEALASLNGTAADAMAAWRTAADAHVAVTEALDRLQRAIASSPSARSGVSSGVTSEVSSGGGRG